MVKLLALIPIAVLAADAGAPWIYTAWAAGIAVSLVVLVRFYARRDGDALRPSFALLMQMRASAASHAAVNLALETADLAMPILVVSLLSASANASFYIAWMIAGFLVMVPLSLSMVAYAIGSVDAAGLSRRFRFTFGISLGFGVDREPRAAARRPRQSFRSSARATPIRGPRRFTSSRSASSR